MRLSPRRSAVLLQQVCDYYNSLNEEILEFHKPLILHEAVEFEKTLQRGCPQTGVSDGEQKGASTAVHPRVTWGDVRTLEDFAIEVEEKFLRLQKKNRQLRRDHEKVKSRRLHVSFVLSTSRQDQGRLSLCAEAAKSVSSRVLLPSEAVPRRQHCQISLVVAVFQLRASAPRSPSCAVSCFRLRVVLRQYRRVPRLSDERLVANAGRRLRLERRCFSFL